MDKFLATELFEKVDKFFEVNITSSKKFRNKFLYFKPYEDGAVIEMVPGYMKGYVYNMYANMLFIPIIDFEKEEIDQKEIVYARIKQLVCSILQTMREDRNYKRDVGNEVEFLVKVMRENQLISKRLTDEIFTLEYDSEKIETLVNSLVDTICMHIL